MNIFCTKYISSIWKCNSLLVNMHANYVVNEQHYDIYIVESVFSRKLSEIDGL